MIPIKIDTDDLRFEFNLSSQEVNDLKERILFAVSKEAERVWRNVVSNSSLKSTRNVYLQGIQVFKEGQYRGGVMLIGVLPNMVESGVSAFDMKEGFLKSSKAKIGKSGNRYITIPLRQATPGAIGESQAFVNQMPKNVYSLAKNLQGKEQVLNKNLPKEIRENKGVRKFVKNETQEFPEYQHKFSIFAGIQKDKRSNHSGYNTFRRVSSLNSDPLSWIHTGIKAYKLADRVENILESGGDEGMSNIVGGVIDSYLNKLGL